MPKKTLCAWGMCGPRVCADAPRPGAGRVAALFAPLRYARVCCRGAEHGLVDVPRFTVPMRTRLEESMRFDAGGRSDRRVLVPETGPVWESATSRESGPRRYRNPDGAGRLS